MEIIQPVTFNCWKNYLSRWAFKFYTASKLPRTFEISHEPEDALYMQSRSAFIISKMAEDLCTQWLPARGPLCTALLIPGIKFRQLALIWIGDMIPDTRLIFNNLSRFFKILTSQTTSKTKTECRRNQLKPRSSRWWSTIGYSYLLRYVSCPAARYEQSLVFQTSQVKRNLLR